MTIADSMLEQGLRADLSVSAEPVKIGDWYCAATINRQPFELEMMDAGYLAKEPVSITILKGTEDSTDTVELDGKPNIPLDLRGQRPRPKMTVMFDSVSRGIDSVQDGGTFWTIMTFRKSVAQ